MAQEYEAYDSDQEAYESSDSQEMREMMGDMSESDSEYAERHRRNSHHRAGRGRHHVPTAKGGSSYREPPPDGFVTQKQLKELAGRIGEEQQRNAQGLKAVNEQFGRLSGRVDDVVSVNAAQGRAVGRLDRQMKLAGALEFAQAYNATTQSLDPVQLLKGAVGYGAIGGDPKGAFSNPLVVGGLAFLLTNTSILSNLVKPAGSP